MDYMLRIPLWNVGSDEADELVEKLADLLVERRLGVDLGDPDSTVRSMIALVPAGTDPSLPEFDEDDPNEFLAWFSEGARLVCLPGKHPKQRSRFRWR